jgi:(4S)-4-hydroxy-5-phosphonooxypentane-2,3-dione isomerase
MQVLSVSIHVKPEHVEAFIPAMLENARGSRTEPGNLRYDLLRDDDDPNHFLLYEVYRDAAALEAHRAAPHFQKWAATVEPWLAAPRTRVRAQPLFYEGEEV